MSEHQLVTPRRNFLIRAVGLLAAGGTVSIPVVVNDTVQKQIEFHLRELRRLTEYST